MSDMRLGTRIAVINEDDQILLSKRGDFGVWALPGGRLDPGETIAASAAREAREETGLDVEIERPVGLYFQQGRRRMNVLYRARPVAGELLGATDETLDNRFFSLDALPEQRFGQFYIDDAFTDTTHLHTQVTSTWELLQIDLKLRWRWIKNWLAGRPEPRFPSFSVWAVGIVWDQSREWVLSVPSNTSENGVGGGTPTLPRILSDGQQHLHQSLNQRVQQYCQQPLTWRWVGLWHNTAVNVIEFIFEAVTTPRPDDHDRWRLPSEISVAQGRTRMYLERAAMSYINPASIWTIHVDDSS